MRWSPEVSEAEEANCGFRFARSDYSERGCCIGFDNVSIELIACSWRQVRLKSGQLVNLPTWDGLSLLKTYQIKQYNKWSMPGLKADACRGLAGI